MIPACKMIPALTNLNTISEVNKLKYFFCFLALDKFKYNHLVYSNLGLESKVHMWM